MLRATRTDSSLLGLELVAELLEGLEHSARAIPEHVLALTSPVVADGGVNVIPGAGLELAPFAAAWRSAAAP